MSGSAILDIALCLSSVYLALSLVCSALNELLANLLALRAKTLAEGVRALLRDDGLVEDFFAHPLVGSLMRPGSRRGPSYVPSRTFAVAALDAMGRRFPSGGTLVERIEAARRARRIDAETARALKALVRDAGRDVRKMRRNLGRGFDDTMDRASGWYRRRTQHAIGGIALVVTLTANADSLAIANQLYRDAGLRAALAASATEAAGASSAEVAGASPATGAAAGALLGWGSEGAALRPVADPLGFAARVAGLLFTAVAASLGAPFWFDTLSRLARLRGAGALPAPSDAAETDARGGKAARRPEDEDGGEALDEAEWLGRLDAEAAEEAVADPAHRAPVPAGR